ncbi:MAG: alpha/beta hydrolase [Candidatus Eremiobacteraeota bacterium]|nr:alpha/beta hydrolase [Candidatus Eremiobacteraeota bacterium]
MLDSRRTFLIASSAATAAAMIPRIGRAATTPPYTERWIPRGSNKLYARDYPGSGPAFVMLHGFPDNLQIYDDLAPILSAAGRRVITFDFLGYGKSDKPSGFAYSFDQQAEDVQIVADALDLHSFVMVPHDAGGPAGINYALSNPARIASLAMLNGFFQPTPLLRFPELIQIFADPDLSPYASSLVANPAQLQSLLNFQMNAFQINLTAAQKTRFTAVLQPIINDNFATGSGPAFVDMTADLRANAGYNTARVRLMRSFPKPVNFVWGSSDPYANQAVGEELASLFPRAKFTVLPLGHWLQIDSPTDVARELLARN